MIEAQLAHGKSGPLGAAYDRAEFVVKRRKMMQLWGRPPRRVAPGCKDFGFQGGLKASLKVTLLSRPREHRQEVRRDAGLWPASGILQHPCSDIATEPSVSARGKDL